MLYAWYTDSDLQSTLLLGKMTKVKVADAAAIVSQVAVQICARSPNDVNSEDRQPYEPWIRTSSREQV
jgi:hypothetical protein